LLLAQHVREHLWRPTVVRLSLCNFKTVVMCVFEVKQFVVKNKVPQIRTPVLRTVSTIIFAMIVTFLNLITLILPVSPARRTLRKLNAGT
jgi:hypothetical protein